MNADRPGNALTEVPWAKLPAGVLGWFIVVNIFHLAFAHSALGVFADPDLLLIDTLAVAIVGTGANVFFRLWLNRPHPSRVWRDAVLVMVLALICWGFALWVERGAASRQSWVFGVGIGVVGSDLVLVALRSLRKRKDRQ